MHRFLKVSEGTCPSMVKQLCTPLSNRSLLLFALAAQALFFWIWKLDGFHFRGRELLDDGGGTSAKYWGEGGYVDFRTLCASIPSLMAVLRLYGL